jgi:hypothetical protein
MRSNSENCILAKEDKRFIVIGGVVSNAKDVSFEIKVTQNKRNDSLFSWHYEIARPNRFLLLG